jgi:hypothetical protein
MEVWRDKRRSGSCVHDKEVVHKRGGRSIHKRRHIRVFVVVSGSGCPLTFPPEVRPPCRTSPAWSIEGDGLCSRSGFTRKPTTEFVHDPSKGFQYNRSSAIYSELPSISLFGMER